MTQTLVAQVFEQPDIDWKYLVPIIVVLGAGVLGVLVEAFVPAGIRRTAQILLSLAAMVAAFADIVYLWRDDAVHATAVGNGLTFPFLGGVSVLGGSLTVDPFALAVQGIVLILAVLGVLVIADRTSAGQDAFAPAAAAVPGSAYEELARRKGLEQTEVFPLVLFATGGMMIFPATSNLLVMFIALEVLSLPLYVLTAMARRRRLLSQEASFKYFLLGAFASALFIFGVALIYGFSGSVNLWAIFNGILGETSTLAGMPALILTGLFLILVGLLFKVGAAPFHMWTPDVYQGAPTPITAYMAACTKAAAFAALVRVLFFTSAPLTDALRANLDVALWIVAILTMVVGTVVAVAQTDMKRMLAYSSIAHAGFVLVGIIGFAPDGFREDLQSAVTSQSLDDANGALALLGDAVTKPVQATVFYLLAYGLATLGAFAVVTLVREKSPAVVSEPVAVAAGGSAVGSGAAAESGDSGESVVLGEATHLSQWAGLGRRHPVLAGVYSLFLLSMAGIPLTAGFIAKFSAFSAAVAGGATVLAVVGVLASAVAVFFYARIIVLMYFTAPAEDARVGVVVVRSRGFTAVAIGICAAGVLILGLLPAGILDIAAEAAKFAP